MAPGTARPALAPAGEQQPGEQQAGAAAAPAALQVQSVVQQAAALLLQPQFEQQQLERQQQEQQRRWHEVLAGSFPRWHWRPCFHPDFTLLGAQPVLVVAQPTGGWQLTACHGWLVLCCVMLM